MRKNHKALTEAELMSLPVEEYDRLIDAGIVAQKVVDIDKMYSNSKRNEYMRQYMREYWKRFPEKVKEANDKSRERYRINKDCPEFKAKKREWYNKYQGERYRSDDEYRERVKAYQRQYRKNKKSKMNGI